MKPEVINQAVADHLSKYLLISACGKNLAIPSSLVSEITPSIVPTRLPFVPHFIEGLVNIKGSVMPLINLTTYIDPDAVLKNPVFVIMQSSKAFYALGIQSVIDEVSSVDYQVNLHQSEPLLIENEATMHVLVNGDINVKGDIYSILEGAQFDNVVNASDDKHEGGGLLGKINHHKKHDETVSLLVFQSLGERFGFNLNDIVEVLEIDTIIPISGAMDCVEGLAKVRDDVLLVLSFPILLGRSSKFETVLKQIVIIERDKTFYGIDISSSVTIGNYSKENFKNAHSEDSLFSTVVIDEQQQVTVVIKPEELIPDELHKKLRDLAPAIDKSSDDIINYKQLLHVTINSLAYAFPLNYVRMVSIDKKIMQVNDSTKHISGIIEIDGRIVSVLDPSQHLGFVNLNKADLEFVIIGDDNAEFALPVSSIKQIIDIPEADIEAITSDNVKHLSAIAHYHGELIPVLNLKHLLTSEYAL